MHDTWQLTWEVFSERKVINTFRVNSLSHVTLVIDLREIGVKFLGKYRKVSNIRRTKSQNLNASRLIL